MAKDPAILWYWQDWNSGTVLLTRFQKGCYMDLLHAQFNNGPLSLEQVKICLGTDFGHVWPVLQAKFLKSPEGLYYNERAELEKEKRRKFVESRRKNGSYAKSYDKHMQKHKDNLTENEDEDHSFQEQAINQEVSRANGNCWNTKPGPELLEMELPEIKAGSVKEQWYITKKQVLSDEDCAGLWRVFKVQHLTGEKFYANQGDFYRHFMNWTRTQTITANEQPRKYRQSTLKNNEWHNG